MRNYSSKQPLIEASQTTPVQTHDKQKAFIIPAEKPLPFLQAVGIMTSEGKIRAEKQHKFIDPEHTAKNIMIRAVKTNNQHIGKYIHEYKALKNYWKVIPYLETLLGNTLRDYLA